MASWYEQTEQDALDIIAHRDLNAEYFGVPDSTDYEPDPYDWEDESDE